MSHLRLNSRALRWMLIVLLLCLFGTGCGNLESSSPTASSVEDSPRVARRVKGCRFCAELPPLPASEGSDDVTARFIPNDQGTAETHYAIESFNYNGILFVYVDGTRVVGPSTNGLISPVHFHAERPAVIRFTVENSIAGLGITLLTHKATNQTQQLLQEWTEEPNFLERSFPIEIPVAEPSPSPSPSPSASPSPSPSPIPSPIPNASPSPGVPVPQIEIISSAIVRTLDNENRLILGLQYHREFRRKFPIVVPIRPSRGFGMAVVVSVDDPVGQGYNFNIWGVNPANENERIVESFPLVGKGSAVYEPINITASRPTKIGMFPKIRWKFTEKFNPTPQNMADTDAPVYVTLSDPHSPQKFPRWDVLEYGVSKANGANTESQVKERLTNSIYSGSGFVYDLTTVPHHTTEHETTHTMTLQVSNWLPFPGRTVIERLGNCVDFSNLFQVCNAALGVDADVRRIVGPFQTVKLYPAGQSEFFARAYTLIMHQTGWVNSHYDPAYRFSLGSGPPVNVQPSPYHQAIRNFGDVRAEDRYLLGTPIRPGGVK